VAGTPGPARKDWHAISWKLEAGDPTVNILRIYYMSPAPTGDRMHVRLRHKGDVYPSKNTHPNGQEPGLAGAAVNIGKGGRSKSRINKRPQISGKDDLWAITVELEADQRSAANQEDETWQVELSWKEGADVIVHCWIERDNFAGDSQSSFADETVNTEDRFATLGSLACAQQTITIGAYGVIGSGESPRAFAASSSGRTAAYRSNDRAIRKPEISAPGVNVVAARSKGGRSRDTDQVAPANADNAYPMVTVKSGTSMAVPAVVGTIALMLQKNPSATLPEIRKALVTTATRLVEPVNDDRETTQKPGDDPTHPTAWDQRFGYGALEAAAAVGAI
jgi:subtilisin family serine protease